MRWALRFALLLIVWASSEGYASASPPVLQVDGEPFFPIGWCTNYETWSEASATQYLSTMKSQGMNSALSCYYTWSSWYLTPMSYMVDAASALDMKIMVEIKRCAVDGSCPISEIDTQVNTLMNYPALLGWWLIDEPEKHGVTVPELRARYDQVRALDIHDHPNAVTNLDPDGYLAQTPPPYCDMLMPFTYPCAEGWNEFPPQLKNVATCAREEALLSIQYGLKAHIHMPQAHNYPGWRLPTYPEQRYLAYAPVIEGARGLYFWMHDLNYTTNEHVTQVVAPIATEISSLIPTILRGAPSLSVVSNRDIVSYDAKIEDVTYMLASQDGVCYLIAANNVRATFEDVVFTVSGTGLATITPIMGSTIPVEFESRDVSIDTSGLPSTLTFTDDFSPFDVNVYRLCESPCPAKVTNSGPGNGSTQGNPILDLQWAAATDATSYNVYFGTENPPPFLKNQTALICEVGPLTSSTTYYWRIDAASTCCSTKGDVWSFSTDNWPRQASGPDPADQETGVALSLSDLSWQPALYATEYDVYWGEAEDSLTKQIRQTGTTYTLTQGLALRTTYYWRIDPVNSLGVTEGEVWSFTTETDPDDLDLDGVLNADDLCSDTVNGADVDSDGCADAQVDADSDGFCDPDAPSTGPSSCVWGTDPCEGGVITDCHDNCPFATNPDQADADSDGVGTICDNCPIHANSDQADCDSDGIGNICTIAAGDDSDCNGNNVPDKCDIYGDYSKDCNMNGIPDECDVVTGAGHNCDSDYWLDECAIEYGIADDCDSNGVPDSCDVSDSNNDCNNNSIPDACEVLPDCNGNAIVDHCEIMNGSAQDCNGNETLDQCEIDMNSPAPGGPFYCTTGCDPDCNSNGVPDECDLGEPIPAIHTYSTGTINNSIPDGGGALSYTWIDVPGNGTILDVNVRVNILHTNVEDLKIELSHGTSLYLVDQCGGSGDHFTNTVFDDEASTPICSGSAPFAGSYRPEGNLSAYDGTDVSGRWRLYVTDINANSETGTLVSWELDVALPGGNVNDCNTNGTPDDCEADADGDGVPDACDNCPNTPTLTCETVDADGCLSDSDQDTVLDGCDNCLETANSDQADADSDGAGDACDDCPNTPPGVLVDDRGCPLPIPGDFDGDRDVDLLDFAHLQVCLSGTDVPQDDPNCQDAKLDGDNDVDADDVGIFVGCASGPNVPADVNCASGG